MSDSDRRIDVKFQLEPSENVRALRWHLVRRGGLPWTAPLAATLSALLGAALYQRGWPWMTSLAAASLALVALAILGVAAVPRLAVRRSPELSEPCRLIFEGDHIAVTVGGRDGVVPWDRYDRWDSNEEFVFLYYEPDRFTLVPRRVLSDAEERRLAALLEEQLGPSGGR